jgi:hypothetical protein
MLAIDQMLTRFYDLSWSIKKILWQFFLIIFLVGCARTEAVRISSNTMIVQAAAAPACGALGASRVAQMSAAIETIKAGFDRYVILGSQSQNNVSVSEGPGTYRSSGAVSVSGNTGFYSGTTTYTPGPTIVSGSRDHAFAIRMFKEGEAGADQAISAREILGPDWKLRVDRGILTCL